MCVVVRARAMGCGKSKHRSLEDSDIDLKTNKNSNHGNSKNGGGGGGGSSNSGSSSSSSSKKDSSWSSSGKRKKQSNDIKTTHKDGDKDEKSSPFKLLSNGKSNRSQSGSGRSEEVGVPAGLSASNKANGSGAEKSNGCLTPNRPYSLEIPNEISKPESNQKTTCRDFKSLTSSKTVHVTSSQIEFFKMLDEKIEKGDGYTTSADVSEVSSLDEHYRH